MSRFTFWFGSRTRLVVAGIAALTLAGSVAAALLVGGSPKSSHAQVVGNLDVGVLVSEQASDGRQQIVVIDHPGAKARTVGTADKFSSIRFAPNAKTVAALAPGDGPGAQASLHLIDAATGRERVVQFPSAALASAVAWSPNSNSVAVVGAIAYLVSREGAVTATAAATASADASSSSLASGGYQWSPTEPFS